jgi:hypothetical protein
MSSLPWVYQSHIAEAKLRDAITISRVALERQGLAGSAWEWITDSATLDAGLK